MNQSRMEEYNSISYGDLSDSIEESYMEKQNEYLFPKMTETMVVKGISMSYLISFLFILFLSIFGIILIWGYFVVGSATGSIIITAEDLYLAFLSIILLPISIMALVRLFKKKSVEIGPEGITLKSKKKNEFTASWSEISKITTGRDLYMPSSSIEISKRDGSTGKISTSAISGFKLKKGFHLIQKYCQFHLIPIDNDSNW